MANECLEEQGYYPGMKQQLAQYARDLEVARANNQKFFEANRELSNEVIYLRHHLGFMTAPDHLKIQELVSWQERVRWLEAEREALLRRVHALEMGQDGRMQQILLTHQSLQTHNADAMREITALRAECERLRGNSLATALPVAAIDKPRAVEGTSRVFIARYCVFLNAYSG